MTVLYPHSLTFRFGSSLYNIWTYLDSGLEAQIFRQLVKAAEDRRQFEAIFEQRESAQQDVASCHTQ